MLVASDSEWEPEEFFELVQKIRRRIQDTFHQDTLVEAIAVELERDHGFIYVSDDSLMAAVNVSTVEEDNFLTELEVEHADRDDDADEEDDDEDDIDEDGTIKDGFRTLYADLDPDPDASRTRLGLPRCTRLLAEEDLQHVPVAHLVGLAFGAQAPVLACLGHRAERDEVLVRHGLGSDEALGEVRVDRPGRLDRRRSVRDRPGAALVRAGGQERDEAEQSVGQRDDPVQTGPVDPELLHEHGRFVRLQFAELHLDPRRQRVHDGVLVTVRRGEAWRPAPGAAARSDSPTLSSTMTGFWVRNRKPRIAFSSSASSSRSRIGRPASSPVLRRRRTTSSRSLASRSAWVPWRPLPASRSSRRSVMDEVRQHELEVEPLQVPVRVHAAVRVRERRVLERADDVEERIGVAQPREMVGRQLLGPDVALG